jgi:hypothetical protein
VSKRTVIDCDKCGHKGVPSPQQIHLTLPKARAVAEDDTTYTETVDLCPVCCTRFLQLIVNNWTGDARQIWVKQFSRIGDPHEVYRKACAWAEESRRDVDDECNEKALETE